jgi:hypothetical protein
MAVNLLMSAKRSRANMADDGRNRPTESRPNPPRSQPPREERPFDVWLNRQLHAMYDDIAREPLPRDVVELIERDGRETAAVAATPADATTKQAASDERPPGAKE